MLKNKSKTNSNYKPRPIPTREEFHRKPHPVLTEQDFYPADHWDKDSLHIQSQLLRTREKSTY